MTGPLPDLSVLDLSAGITGPYTTRLLADYGADVVKVEPPRGDIGLGLGPFPGGVPHPEKSGTFFVFNTNKRSVVLDLKHPDRREAQLHLVDRADVVVESYRPGLGGCLARAVPVATMDRRPARRGAGVVEQARLESV